GGFRLRRNTSASSRGTQWKSLRKSEVVLEANRFASAAAEVVFLDDGGGEVAGDKAGAGKRTRREDHVSVPEPSLRRATHGMFLLPTVAALLFFFFFFVFFGFWFFFFS
ncbi:hypothetical protein IscW_ISCW016123, partial [Ixodes scapularis]